MRRVFLIRHGHPDFPLGAHVCLGRTDTPLGPLGRMQAALLGETLLAPDDEALLLCPGPDDCHRNRLGLRLRRMIGKVPCSKSSDCNGFERGKFRPI